MEKPKVLIFIDWFSPGYKAGGPITSNVNIVDHLSNDVEFYVITSSYDYHAIAPYENIVENEWLDYRGAKIMYINPSCLSRNTLRCAAEAAVCDVWYINGIYSRYYSIYPLILARLLKPKKVIVGARGMLSPHALAVKSISKKLFLTIAKILGLYRIAIFHATNYDEKNYIQSAISKKCEVIVAENLPRKMILQSDGCEKNIDEVRLVSFARISPEKNTLFAIKALTKCNKRVVYHIYGQINSDSYWQECQEVINSLPSHITVEYKGSVEPHEMTEIYKNNHALYMPSTGENYGHAILESFMNGCPVVISNKTPWLDLEEKNIGWDLPLNEDLYADVIDNFSAMNGDIYKQMRQDVVAFISEYLNNSETRNRYLNMYKL
ncbi:MAG: glycosyltransferase [bacterium]